MRKDFDPMTTDFRALDMLLRVYRFKSFTKAAEDLDVNQSVVSYTIDKLRVVFDDPLFAREARHLIATPRCEEIVAQAEVILDRFAQLTATQIFEPRDCSETIHIACNYYERALIVPDLIHAIRTQAPKMKVEIVDSSYLGHDRLLRMEADLLIGPFTQLGEAFYSRTLYEDRYVCMMDPEHPLAGEALTLEAYLALEHVYISYGGKWKSRYMQALEQQGHELSIAIRTPSPAGIEKLIKDSELIATIPERLSRQLSGSLHITSCPIHAPVTIQMVWTGRTHTSPMHKWLRDLIFSTSRKFA